MTWKARRRPSFRCSMARSSAKRWSAREAGPGAGCPAAGPRPPAASALTMSRRGASAFIRTLWLMRFVPVGGPGVTWRLCPVLGGLDLGVDVCVDLEQVQQVAAGQELKRLVFGEVEGCFAEAGGCDEDALGGALVVNASEQVTDRAHRDRVFVAFGLDNDFPAEYRPAVEGNAVNAAVSRGLGHPCLQAHLGEEI